MYRMKKLPALNIQRVAPYIREALIKSSPPSMPPTNEAIRNVLVELVTGKAECWILYKDADGKLDLHMIAVTAILRDPLSKSYVLHVYALYAFNTLNVECIKLICNTLRNYARINGCIELRGISSSKELIGILKWLGFSDLTYLSLEV